MPDLSGGRAASWLVGFLIFFLLGAAHAQSVRFAAIGDYGDASEDERDVADLIAGWNVDFVITMGDNRYGARTYDATVGAYYCAFLKDAESGPNCSGDQAATNAFFPSIGNHEYDDGIVDDREGIDEYLDYFTLPGADFTSSSGNERYYDFVWGDVHFFVVNSDAREPDGITSTSTQAQWLQAQLGASTAPWKVVFMHHPPYSSSSNHGSTVALQWPYADWGADAVIGGHDHIYERILRDNIVYFVNGLGGRSAYELAEDPVEGSQVRYNANYGAMLMEADAASLSFRFVNRNGEEIDSYLLTRTVEDTVAVKAGWNLLGLPLDVNDASLATLFGGAAVSSAYSFVPGTGYVAHSSLVAGDGYWILFGAASEIAVTGTPRTSVEVPVAAGWNLVSGPGCSMPVADIEQAPAGTVQSLFYEFSTSGYTGESTMLQPWKGYWVLIEEAGTLTMACP